MISSEILNRNLLALSSRESRISSRLSLSPPSEDVFFIQSRNGYPVPVIRKNSRDYPLHSTFNPQKEAFKFASEYPSGGYMIFLGFGCGYQIEPFLKRENVNNILIIDNNLSYLKAQLTVRDLRKIILDPRVHFLVDASPNEVRDYLLSHCFPVLTGDIQSIPLRSRIDLVPDYFTEIFNTVKDTLGSLADDFTVQTSFGKKWFVNTLRNLETAGKVTSILNPVSKVIVTAAGPSLESDLAALKDSEGTFIIATDTSYPALRKNSIVPDLVISIDCQHISYHHFLSGFDPGIPIVLDLASPPGLSRISNAPIFFTSGHPFSIYISRFWRKFPFIDTSGGNVTHAAISLAEHLGAKTIDIIGADFCYPLGKSYSRGTYIYPHFHSLSTRNDPAEYLFYNFIFRNPKISEELSGEEKVYMTYTLNEYRNRLFTSFADKKIIINNRSPYSNFPSNDDPSDMPDQENNKTVQFFGSGAADGSWHDFISFYHEKLSALPCPAKPLAGYFEQLSPEKRGLWLTLFPAAASIRKQCGKDMIDSAKILEMAYDWTLNIIKRYL